MVFGLNLYLYLNLNLNLGFDSLLVVRVALFLEIWLDGKNIKESYINGFTPARFTEFTRDVLR